MLVLDGKTNKHFSMAMSRQICLDAANRFKMLTNASPKDVILVKENFEFPAVTSIEIKPLSVGQVSTTRDEVMFSVKSGDRIVYLGIFFDFWTGGCYFSFITDAVYYLHYEDMLEQTLGDNSVWSKTFQKITNDLK